MSKEQGTILILDIGRNVSAVDEKDEKCFFQSARECAARIIERKILNQGKNLIGIILVGSKTTNNNLAKQFDGAFKRIQVLSDMVTPTWEMIRQLPEQPTDTKGDWFEALIVAADYYKNVLSGVKLENKQIILLTNFKKKASFDPENIDEVLNGFVDEGYEVNVIGPDIESEEYEKNESVQLVKRFIDSTGGATSTIDNIMKYDLLFHRKKLVKGTPWNVDLSIGPNIKIPVSAYIRTRDEPAVKNWVKSVKDPATGKSSKSESVTKTKEYINEETGQAVDGSNKISGHHYGQQIIPLSEIDKNLMYQSGVKCLSVYGFTSADNIQWQNLNGNGLSYVFGRKGDKKAQKVVRCLVECLHDLNLVCIVRKVHNNNNLPKLHVLMPVIDTNNYVCLSMIGICYKEEIKQMSFPTTNLKKHKCSEEQVNAFKDLISAMDLTNAYDDTFDDNEAFPVAECVSPSVQYVLDCIAFRALNPDKPLPKPREEIMTLFKVPPLLEENARKPLEKLKTLFTLTKVEQKKRQNKNLLMNIDQMQNPNQTDNPITPNMQSYKVHMPTKDEAENAIKSISTINPVEDFKALQSQNKDLSELTKGMIKAIESLILYNIDGKYNKALDAMKHLRMEFIKSDPTDYNNWIKKLKSDLVEHGKTEVLNQIIENQVSFILKRENELSNYEEEHSHDESQLFENDTIPDSTEITISTDVLNMFDD
ncbi:X-ray repair cross-complementing protein 5 [Spodoptera frugiperda]|uniref:X-ray repair cross-complementing protein 5 n=1 Tax=Spodoptera frugiperda TaxID=7108 RepID=A0A9R0D8J9_SPOFR|nr:X-ray repair cross-complementing protein 5 [Spodoptera frugiperda]